MAGHWGLLLGYAVFPLFIKEITKRELKIKNTALWLSLISILSTHMLAMAFIVLLIFIRKPFKKYLWIFPLFILLNVYWLYPALSAKTTTISIIDRDDIAAFISRNHFVNILITNAMLYGFWRAKAYLMPSMFLLAPLFVIILYLVVHGSLYADFRFKKRFLIMAVIALIISVGVAHPLTLGIYEWFFEIAFMRGFREPNKFIALLSLSYCVLGAYGLEQIRGKKMMAALVLPFLFTPVLFTLNRQLTPIDYPADYYEMNDFLNKDKDDFNILFLPWYLYLDFRWIENRDRRIANPSGIFFDKPVIKGDNMELYPIYSHSLNPISRYVEENLGSARNLSLINIRYILIAKEYNLSIKDATKVKETENLILLKNNQETHKFLQSDDLKAFHKLEYRKKSAISYELESDMKYIIFTEAYDTNW